MTKTRERTIDFDKFNKLLASQIMAMDKDEPFKESQWSYIVQEAIANERLDVIKLIFKMGKISHTHEENYFFGDACMAGDMRIVEYFLDDLDVDIRIGGNYAVKLALEQEHYTVLQKIFSNKNFNIDIVDEQEQENEYFIREYSKFKNHKKMGKFKDLLKFKEV